MPVALAVALAFSIVIPPPCGGVSQERPAGSQDQKEASEGPTGLARGKKLVLKDGTYHLVREYQRKGDRVRYYSVERSAWEEIPVAIVDWEATRRAETEVISRTKELAEEARAAQLAERTADIDVDASIEVAPGVFLPGGEGLFAVQGKVVTPLTQSAADIKLDKGRLLTQVLVPIPVVPTRHKVQIPGKRAQTRLSGGQMEFYMRVAPSEPGRESEGPREPAVELIRAQVKGNARQVEFVSTYITGERAEKRKTIPIQRWTVARGLYRFTLGPPLEPGEYALAEILQEGMNLYVWDFGVDPSAARPRPSQSNQKPTPRAPSSKTRQNPPHEKP